jgi:RNA-binding protein FUS
MIIGTPVYFGNIQKYCNNKAYKRKQKPFTEREGDWICNNCKNLNFSFRKECNRCKLPKGADEKANNKDESKKDNNNTASNTTNTNNNKENKCYQKKERYNKNKKNNNYNNNNNKKNENEGGKE